MALLKDEKFQRRRAALINQPDAVIEWLKENLSEAKTRAIMDLFAPDPDKSEQLRALRKARNAAADAGNDAVLAVVRDELGKLEAEIQAEQERLEQERAAAEQAQREAAEKAAAADETAAETDQPA